MFEKGNAIASTNWRTQTKPETLFVFKLAVIFLNAVVFNATVLICGPYATSVPF